PGNEQSLYWGSASATEPGSRNYIGVTSDAIDTMIQTMLSVEDQESFEAAVRAMDRVLMSGRYVVPFWYPDVSYLAHDATLRFPAETPIYGDWIGFLPDVWWQEP
ncbi:MAG: ABC transporter substrate-binding protein, partial [Pseudomonadota bacterium]